MKTLRQFYDSLTDDSKSWIEINCNEWFDKNESDCYRKQAKQTLDDILKDFKDKLPAKRRYASPDREELSNTIMKIASMSNSALSDDLMLQWLESYDGSYVHPKFFLNATDANKQKIFEKLHGLHYIKDTNRRVYDLEDADGEVITKYTLNNYLYTVKDYDNLDVNLISDTSGTAPLNVIRDIFKEKAADLLKATPELFGRILVKGQMDDIFDQLFFCKDGWNDDQKRKALREVYIDALDRHGGERNQKIIKDFMERIVAVDHSYLRYVHTLIGEDIGSAMKYINQKKDDGSNEFLYSKDVRKLMKLSWICHRKSYSQVNGASLKELTPLLKIYGYNFNLIYNSLYPDDEVINISKY